MFVADGVDSSFLVGSLEKYQFHEPHRIGRKVTAAFVRVSRRCPHESKVDQRFNLAQRLVRMHPHTWVGLVTKYCLLVFVYYPHNE